jgi:hypothetical protein
LENGVVSPFLHSYVHKRNGKKTLYIYARLVDGVHSTHALSAAWTRHIETPIDINERNLYKEFSFHFSYEHKNVRMEIQPHFPIFFK